MAQFNMIYYYIFNLIFMKLILPFFSELWVLPESKPIGRAFLSDLKVKIVEAFNLKTGNSWKCDNLFLRGDEISLV